MFSFGCHKAREPARHQRANSDPHLEEGKGLLVKKLRGFQAGITIGIVVVLLIISALFTWAAVLHELDGENKGGTRPDMFYMAAWR